MSTFDAIFMTFILTSAVWMTALIRLQILHERQLQDQSSEASFELDITTGDNADALIDMPRFSDWVHSHDTRDVEPEPEEFGDEECS